MRPIDADNLENKVVELYTEGDDATEGDKVVNDVIDLIDNAPTVERPQGDFTIDELRTWLYEIAFNNDNDFGLDCLEIIDRLDGFERFVADMREKEANDE